MIYCQSLYTDVPDHGVDGVCADLIPRACYMAAKQYATWAFLAVSAFSALSGSI